MRMNRLMTLLGSLVLAAGSQANDLETIDQRALDNNQAAKTSQQKIDKLYDQHREALQDFRLTRSEIEQLKVYNRQLSEIIENQNAEVASLENQIEQIEFTQRGIMPLMERMLAGLDKFVELDLPFLKSEREERITNLNSLLLSADTTVSEKFRRVMEAYQIELEYGRTIETYREPLSVESTGEKGKEGELVDFLRLGRVAFYYVTLDGSSAHVWSKQTNAWVELDGSYIRSLQKGIQIARKQAAPSLLNLNVPTPRLATNQNPVEEIQ